MATGFDRANARSDQLNDQMATGFDRTNSRIDSLHGQMAIGFDHVNVRLDRIEGRAANQYRWLAGIVITMSAGMIASTITIAVAVIGKL